MPMIIPGPVFLLLKFAEIFAAQGAPPVSLTTGRWQIEEIFKQKSFAYFVWKPLGSRVANLRAGVVDSDDKIRMVALIPVHGAP
jgi:hypothetical protein